MEENIDSSVLWHTSHFDLLEEYDGEIPSHVASYLNSVKTNKTVFHVKQYLHGSLRGLDVGCGTGDHALTIQRLLTDSVIDGLDGSSRQLERARRKGFPNRLIHASMTQTGLKEAEYDFVVAVNSIHHLSSREHQSEAFREFERILKPGGILVIHEISQANPLMRFYMKFVFTRTRSIDNGTEIFLKVPLIDGTSFRLLHEEYFTFVPDFTPRVLMPLMKRLDQRLSRSLLRKFGAHVLWVLQR